MTMILASSQNSEAQPMSIEKWTAVSFGLSSVLIVRVGTPLSRSYPVNLRARLRFSAPGLHGLDRIRLKYSHLEADFLALKRS